MDFLGDWWTPVVLREAFLGTTRFDDFQSALDIGRNVLTQRLNRLVQEGIMERHKYQDRPPRFEYRLTAKGRDFFDVVAAMLRWGDRWLDGGRGAPLAMHHRDCGQVVHAKAVCSCCDLPLRSEDVTFSPGAGMPADVAKRFREREALRRSRRG